MTDALRASYDATPYDSKPISATHLDNIVTVARLHGLTPARPERCRVLELGCASGGNLMPMAFRYPESTFVGVDLSPAQVDAGRHVATALGLRNITLEARSITELDAGAGPFDFIIGHGVYSWVPAEVADAILRICDECLAPRGIAYVSYNTYPGWHARMMLRQMMMTNDDASLPPLERATRARAYAERIGARAAHSAGAHALTIQHELVTLRSQRDAQILHEQLEEFNEPVLLTDFVRRANARGLRYVADARIADSRWPDPEALGPVEPAEQVCREQETDFVIGQTFRRSLLCRAELAIDTGAAIEIVRDLYVVMRATPVPPGADPQESAPGVKVFRAPAGFRLGTASPVLLAVFDELWSAVPSAIAFSALEHAVRRRIDATGGLSAEAEEDIARLPTVLLRIARADMIAFASAPSGFTTSVSDRPRASALARWQAAHGATIADLRHAPPDLPAVALFLLPYLDGAHDRHQLVVEVQRALDDGRMSTPVRPTTAQIATVVDEGLRCLASSALLVS